VFQKSKRRKHAKAYRGPRPGKCETPFRVAKAENKREM
jgi:hypothetical protein